jgi:hypothetical protein
MEEREEREVMGGEDVMEMEVAGRRKLIQLKKMIT